MKFAEPVSIKWIAEFIGADIKGNADGLAKGINEIHRVESGDLVFVDHPKYYDKCINSDASFIIINADTNVPDGKALLITSNPFEAYCKIVNHFRPFTPVSGMRGENISIGEGSVIYDSAFIGNHVSIGKNCIIYPNVTIMDYCVLGDDVIIQSGTTIGSDAFYYSTKKDREQWYKKMSSGGRVVLEDGVEIGANCTIDRGVSHDTIIGMGTKFDNLIHIGHDTVIGHNCLFAAGTMVAGASTIGNGVVVWGQCVINKTLTIGDNAVLLARTGVGSSLEGGKTYWGAPAQEAGVAKRELVWIKRIPEMWEKLKNL